MIAEPLTENMPFVEVTKKYIKKRKTGFINQTKPSIYNGVLASFINYYTITQRTDYNGVWICFWETLIPVGWQDHDTDGTFALTRALYSAKTFAKWPLPGAKPITCYQLVDPIKSYPERNSLGHYVVYGVVQKIPFWTMNEIDNGKYEKMPYNWWRTHNAFV